MIRTFDLGMDQVIVEQFLNDPQIQLQKVEVFCSELGLTSLVLTYRLGQPAMPRKKRMIVRYLIFHGINKDLNQILSEARYRVIELRHFQTEQGTVAVVDYQIKGELIGA